MILESNLDEDKTLSEEFQRFTITTVNQKYLMITSLLFSTSDGILFLLCLTLPEMIKLASLIMVVIAIGFLITMIIIRTRLKQQTELEFYADKLIIMGKENVTINFRDIQAYGVVYGKGRTSLTIKLDTDEKITITTLFANGLGEFIEAFEAKIQELRKEKNYAIGKLTDWTSVIIITLICTAILLYVIRLLI